MKNCTVLHKKDDAGLIAKEELKEELSMLRAVHQAQNQAQKELFDKYAAVALAADMLVHVFQDRREWDVFEQHMQALADALVAAGYGGEQ